MYFTKFLKGIPVRPGFDDRDAIDMLENSGIVCNWWRKVKKITPKQVAEKLTDEHLLWHLQRYDDIWPGSAAPFSEETPYISTTAGVVERDSFYAENILIPALHTALWFATNRLTRSGYIFRGYVITLGKKAIPFQEYAEEVRELNTYTEYLRFHPEGELTAKINIPSHRLEQVEKWDIDDLLADLDAGRPLMPSGVKRNWRYSPPEDYANIREVLSW